MDWRSSNTRVWFAFVDWRSSTAFSFVWFTFTGLFLILEAWHWQKAETYINFIKRISWERGAAQEINFWTYHAISSSFLIFFSFVRNAGWDLDLVNEAFPWVEKQIVQWPKLAPWQTALRNGLLQAGISPFNGYTYDHINGTKIGGTIFTKHGFRRTAADLLLSGNPKNLKVLLHATVQKILFDTKGIISSFTESVISVTIGVPDSWTNFMQQDWDRRR